MVATNSSYLMFAISLGLASCLPGYFREKTKNGSELGPLITETAVFNFSGQSSTGRTTLSLATLGLFAPPGLIAKWDFTRRGLEELAESYNDLLFVLDDTEKHVDGSTNFKTALRWVNQIIPSGKSKFVSETTMMPSLTWTTFGLTSSPKALNQIAAEVHWNRSEGELVRWIDIPVPPRDEGGIFDRIDRDEQKPMLLAAELIKILERGVAQNYGGIFPLWSRYLLDEDRSKELKHFVDVFVRKMAPHGDSWDQRLATKFGVVFAAGVMAVDARILPWTRRKLGTAIRRCYLRAIEAMNAEANAAQKFLKVIGGRLDTPEYFPRASGTAAAVDLDEPVIGLRALYKGANVVAIRDDTLIRRAGSSSAANSVLELLKSKDLIRGGHGHAGTTQLPVTIRIGDTVIQKPRFWLIDIVGLQQWLRAKEPNKAA